MTVTAINYLNILLILLSAGLAYIFPFELFLFSYAILGPLHYMTEIGWLHKRNYFTTGRRDYMVLSGLCLLALLLFLVDKAYQSHLISSSVVSATGIKNELFSPLLRTWISNIIIIAFVAAFAMVLFKDNMNKIIFTLIASGSLLLLWFVRPYLIILALLLPTVLHVTLFTVTFMLFGAMKDNSISGYTTAGVFVVCCFLFFLFDPGLTYQAHPFFIDRFLQGDFINVNNVFTGNTDLHSGLFSPFGLKVQRFIAFAYTYHYLNWFSKTKVIDWFNVPPTWRWFSVIAWIVSIGLYVIDFQAGLIAVFFLAILHVFLEFPLNYRTFIAIGGGITKWAKRG